MQGSVYPRSFRSTISPCLLIRHCCGSVISQSWLIRSFGLHLVIELLQLGMPWPVINSIESARLKTGKLINHNLQSLSDTFPDISFGVMVGTSNGSDIVFHDIQSNNTASWPTFPGGERAMGTFSSRGKFSVTSPASSLNFCSSNMQSTSKTDFGWFLAKHATPVSGCPRVFCMGKSGWPSNTGLLGIVLILQHLGLHGVNPGNAVRMESGETIAQWQKLYFLKSGDILKYAEDHKHDLCNKRRKTSVQEHTNMSIINSDYFCCICQISSNDEANRLLECSSCPIKVHQACYGFSALPRQGGWCCRSCRAKSKDIVPCIKACVLCGYEGGAMTRALSSHSIVKSLLKEWNSEKNGRPISYTSRSDKRMSRNGKQNTPSSVTTFEVHNSITAGVLDPTVKQWVHTVCGLWTPGARCRNKYTMSSMNVSGVSRPKADVVCSICNRWGGSCIECRIVDCSVKFHPWCAYQKNLLQNEIEGVNDEKVGFYGRCVLHGIGPDWQSAFDPTDAMDRREEKEFTCARTEGYKGGCSALKPRGGYRVPDEQLNAWIHINGQKLRSQGIPKFPASDIERDSRKEYARYKQVEGWKNLCVFKSGIHGHGLYTSQFISRGSMVVEYVGEIVGQRVADKREIEYISGRKLQYKNACYFFTIDKEHIIDATRKGGIARFINHSCLPNCAAEVITVRDEKKVVFFAERDILAGEEITYNYNFNREDEEKKIPCYCNSKNCRRSMN